MITPTIPTRPRQMSSVCKPLDTRGFETLLSDFRNKKRLQSERSLHSRSPFSTTRIFISNRGAQKAHRAVPNEALYGDLRISGLINQTYLFYPKWQKAKPRTFRNCTMFNMLLLFGTNLEVGKDCSTY